MTKTSAVYVAGHGGLVGSAIVRRLESLGYSRLITASRSALDLRDQLSVERFFAEHKPEYVFLAAAKVGGILANDSYPAEFIRDNILIQSNVIHAAYAYGVKKLALLGSSCIYPKLAEQPIREESLLTGALEPTNEWYAVAKIAGVKMAQAYRRQYGFSSICLMPTNLYGPGDSFNPDRSHVIPALLYKFHSAKMNGDRSVSVWGTGRALREFLHVDDLARACEFLMHHYDSEEIINVGVGHDLTIGDLAVMIADVVGYTGEIRYDQTKPDGTPRKVLDISKILKLGWKPAIGLRPGLEETYAWMLMQVVNAKDLPSQAQSEYPTAAGR